MIATPYESTGEIVDLGPEAAWYDTLVADSGRVTKVVLGQSTGGNPLHLLGIGGTAPPTWPPTAPDGMIIVGAQHTYWEPASREAVMAVARDCAYDARPDRVDEWDQRPLWVFPNWNPDGYVTRTGGTNWAEGNPNRDSLSGNAPATHLYYSAIRQISPATIVDVHEHGSGGLTYPTELGSTRNLGTYGRGPLSDEADALLNYIRVAMGRDGYTVGVYPATASADTLNSWCQLAGIVGLLIETNGGSNPLDQRVARSMIAQHAALSWHLANRDRLAHIKATDRHVTATRGRDGQGIWSVSNALNAAVAGYMLTAAQWSEASAILATHGIASVPDDQDETQRYVPLDQPTARIAVRILDPSSPEGKVDGTRVAATPSWYTPDVAPAPPTGEPEPRVEPSVSGAVASSLSFTDGSPATLYDTTSAVTAPAFP